MTSLTLTPLARRIIETAAIDAYPKEAVGVLLGANDVVEAAYGVMTATRTAWVVDTTDDTELRLYEHLGDAIIGDFHSHPDATPAASQVDKSQCLHSNTPFLGEGSYMVVVSVWPGKARPWRFDWAAYQVVGERVRRVRILSKVGV